MQTNVPADPPGRRRPARRGPAGHPLHQDPRRRPRRWQEALPAEGHRPGPSGLDPRAAVRRRWRRPRTPPARLLAADAQEDEGRRAARCALRPQPARPGARPELAGRGRHAVDQVGRRRARGPRARGATCSSCSTGATWSAGRACATWTGCTCSASTSSTPTTCWSPTTSSSPPPRWRRSWPARRRARRPRRWRPSPRPPRSRRLRSRTLRRSKRRQAGQEGRPRRLRRCRGRGRRRQAGQEGDREEGRQEGRAR